MALAMSAGDLPALSGAERLLLQRAGVGRAGVLAVRQVLAVREQAIAHREKARADAAIEYVRRREEDSYDQGHTDGYDAGNVEGYKEGLDHGEEKWHQTTLDAAEEAHRFHAKPAKWCTEGLCAYVWSYSRGEMVRGA